MPLYSPPHGWPPSGHEGVCAPPVEFLQREAVAFGVQASTMVPPQYEPTCKTEEHRSRHRHRHRNRNRKRHRKVNLSKRIQQSSKRKSHKAVVAVQKHKPTSPSGTLGSPRASASSVRPAAKCQASAENWSMLEPSQRSS